MNLIKPKRLEPGDTIGLLSASGFVPNVDYADKAALYFQKLGYKTIISETTYKQFRYCAGTDEERINEIHNFFVNPDINAIVCTRGGYGLLRIADKIDYKLLAKYPKIFCGYSDITVLLLMLYKNSNLLTFHGPMALGDFGINNVSIFTENHFFNILTNNFSREFIADDNGKIFNSGSAQGILWGGNLTTIASMIGLDFIPDERFILFIEDINEPAYKIDRTLTQIFLNKKFKNNIAGIVLGIFSNTDNKNYVDDIISEFSKLYNLPCCSGFKISHEKDKLTVPIGVKCLFSANQKMFSIIEPIFL